MARMLNPANLGRLSDLARICPVQLRAHSLLPSRFNVPERLRSLPVDATSARAVRCEQTGLAGR
ncbi:hypothetical protein, partial [Klebsiella pneumoniae]|uniref:hypothetical protein n=1 Tax=Klebsiella pneumoniae TaxID=573 RepID=UPI001BA84587